MDALKNILSFLTKTVFIYFKKEKCYLPIEDGALVQVSANCVSEKCVVKFICQYFIKYYDMFM